MKTRVYILILVIVNLAIRVLLYSYTTGNLGDSKTYKILAAQIVQLNDSTRYAGERTPVYPILIISSGFNDEVLRLYQHGMGIAISVMVFILTFRKTKNAIFSFAAGILCSLPLNFVLFEAHILTETLTAFLLVLSLFFLDRPLIGGMLHALLVLTRPPMLAIVPFFALFQKRWLTYILPIAIGIISWSSFNQATKGFFGLTAYTGANLFSHAEKYVHLSSDKVFLNAYYADTNKIYWQKFLSMRVKLRKDQILLYRRLGSVALGIFWTHPHLYLKSVSESWVDFWNPKLHWLRWNLKYGYEAFISIWDVERIMLVGLYISFGLGFIVRCIQRKYEPLSLGIIGFSLAQALLQNGSNSRFILPFYPLLILFTFTAWWDILSNPSWLKLRPRPVSPPM